MKPDPVLPDATTAADLVVLLQRVAGGDREAFARLYRATSAKLLGVILRILRRRELAEEILQEVYVTIWRRAGDYEPGRASPITWMAVIARNRALDAARRRMLPLSGDPPDEQRADEAASPAERAELNEDMRRLEACLAGLEEDRRSMVLLAYHDGLTREELAARFGHPVGTIKTWLHRSLRQLRDCLGS